MNGLNQKISEYTSSLADTRHACFLLTRTMQYSPIGKEYESRAKEAVFIVSTNHLFEIDPYSTRLDCVK